jgi:hypothetical protein
MFSTGRAETTFAGMGNKFNMPTIFAAEDMAPQYRGTAGQYLAYIFKDNGPDPSLVLDYKLYPMSSKYGRNMVMDMRCGAEHTLVFGMNSNIFQAEEKDPIFHYSIIPIAERSGAKFVFFC